MEKEERNILIVATLGMAFWWPLLRNSIVGFLFSPSRVPEPWAHGCLWLFLAVSALVACGGVLALGSERGRRIIAGRGSAALVLAPCVAASVLGLLLVAVPAAGEAALVAADAVILACVYGALPLGWCTVLLRWFGPFPKRLLLVAATSYGASFLVGYLSYTPDPLNLVRPVGAPLLSAVAWLYCWRDGNGGSKGRAAVSDGAGETAAVPGMARADGRSLYGLVLVMFLVSSVATGFINSGTASYDPSPHTFVRDTLNVVATLSIIALIAASKSVERIKFTLIVAIVVLLFGGIFLATLFRQSWFTIGVGLIQTGKSCFSLLLFMLVVLEGAAGPAAAGRSLLLKFVLPTIASSLISYLIVPLAAEALGVAYNDFWGVLSLLLGFSLGVFLFGFLSSLVIRYLPRVELTPAPGQTEAVVLAGAMARAYGLTEKEAEVLGLLLEGNTYKKIAALMYVSDSTVQSHAKSIYRKVDVHTKQQLVDRALALRDRPGR